MFRQAQLRLVALTREDGDEDTNGPWVARGAVEDVHQGVVNGILVAVNLRGEEREGEAIK